MKFQADRWLYLVAVLAIAAVLFVPLQLPTVSWELFHQLNPASLVPVCAWFLAVAAFWGFRSRFWPLDNRESRRLGNAMLLLVLQASLLRTLSIVLVVYTPLPRPWLPAEVWVWFPWFLIPGLSGILLGWRPAVLVCLVSGFMLYLLGDPGPWPLVGCMAASTVGILLLRRSPTRGRVLRAGTAAGALLGFVAAAHCLFDRLPWENAGAAFLGPFLLGALSSFVVLAMLPVLEWVLGELSDVRLIEYGTDHPLLDQLRTLAPGTWNHSLNVADLAEKAAAEIGARALFCKTAALYHDVGKLKEPALFVENNSGPSPHDQLEPHISAARIIEHVSHGADLARKYGLPKAFREIITEHHGVSPVRFFYARACRPLPDGSLPKVDRAAFCYPGPKPSTRESGIVALADAVEAASRSVTISSEKDLQAFVRNLVADRVAQGELSDCPLTLADLAKIELSFLGWLRGRHHTRPAYPEPANSAVTGSLLQSDKETVAQPA